MNQSGRETRVYSLHAVHHPIPSPSSNEMASLTTRMNTKEKGHQGSDPAPSVSSNESLVNEHEYGYCTFAVTGARPYFQAIYICHSCCSATTPAAQAPAVADGDGKRHVDENKKNDDDDDSKSQDEGLEELQRPPIHLCICQACAQTCHRHEENDGGGKTDDDDDNNNSEASVEYIGMGPSYCDCPFNTKYPCRIAHASQQEAERLQIQPFQLHRQRNDFPGSDDNCRNIKQVNETTTKDEQAASTIIIRSEKKQTNSCTHFVRDVFHIPTLHDNEALIRLLRQQAETLVQHSKETFWIDYHHNSHSNDSGHVFTGTSNNGGGGDGFGCCALESLAWAVARNHIQHYAASQEGPLVTHETLHGMEWWVQVKHVQHQPTSAATNCTNQQKELQHGIELHFDKDEAMAESFGLGVFPALSTVTYLCEPATETMRTAAATSSRVPPTLIFSHCYDSICNCSDNDDDDDNREMTDMTNIPDMLVSHAYPGKHLAFDGRLLHGAPAHEALRPPLHLSMTNAHGNIVFAGVEDLTQYNNTAATAAATASDYDDINNHSSFTSTTRITFLVNLWTHEYKPAGVQILPDHVRHSLLEHEQQEGVQQSDTSLFWDMNKPWKCEEIVSVELQDETTDLPLELCGRIELPFVGSNTLDKQDQDQEDDDGEEEEEERMVVVTFPPPPSVHSTMRVRFGPGLQAYLDHPAASTNTSSSDQRQQKDESTLRLPASLARLCEQQTLETTPTGASTSATAFI
jgi:hypothetical protein